jgi:4-aminobutyrate aminotransferase-like enzyme
MHPASTQDAFFPRAFAATMPTIVAGSGVHLTDDRGRRLLDVCSGPFLAALGQGNDRVLAAMHDQGRRLTYTYSRTTRHPANAALTERLVALATTTWPHSPDDDSATTAAGGARRSEQDTIGTSRSSPLDSRVRCVMDAGSSGLPKPSTRPGRRAVR